VLAIYWTRGQKRVSPLSPVRPRNCTCSERAEKCSAQTALRDLSREYIDYLVVICWREAEFSGRTGRINVWLMAQRVFLPNGEAKWPRSPWRDHQCLRDRGVTAARLGQVRSPAGLDIRAAEGPQANLELPPEEAKDPICGMSVGRRRRKVQIGIPRKFVLLLPRGCKQRFDKQPDKYALATVA
jgi:YHS domain-containing protein